MQFLILQHLDIEPPALIADELEKAGHSLTTVHLDQGQTLPAPDAGFDGVIIMGGPQSANDDTDYILAELAWLKNMISAGMPMLGICLGAQLMAKAAGAGVFPAAVRELGWLPVYHTNETADDPVFRNMPDGLSVFQWHGETFSLTDSMVSVASNPDVPAQAFRIGAGQYGLQSHVEINQSIIESWIAHGTSERGHLGIEGISLLHKDSKLYLASMQHFCKQLVRAWLQEITP